MSFIPEVSEDLHELIKKARELTGDHHIMYNLDSGMHLDDFREYLLKLIEESKSKTSAEVNIYRKN